jgi:hypothetical protein
MVLFYSSAHGSIFEVKEDGKNELVAEKLRSESDGRLLAASPELQDTAKTSVKILEWMLTSVNPRTLPVELQPIQLHLLKAQAALKRSSGA